MKTSDVLIIGGGVCGCALARELQARGASVTVVERDEVGAHASGKSWGGLYPASGAGIPGPLAEPARLSAELHRGLYAELVDETGIDYELRPVESISLASDESQLDGLQDECSRLIEAGYDAELLAAGRLYELEPDISPGMAGGLLQGSQQELDSLSFTRSLAKSAQGRGATFKKGEAISIRAARGRVKGISTAAGEFIPASRVVIAAGPWAGGIGPDGAGRLPIRPVKGEILRLRLPGNSFRHRVGMGGYNLGRKPDGLVWVGTTEWEVGYDAAPSTAGRDDILAGVSKYAPPVAWAAIVEHTACLRPVSSDGLPVIGPLASADGLYAMAGAGKKGVLLSLAMAKMAAGVVLEDARETTVPAELLTGRFGL